MPPRQQRSFQQQQQQQPSTSAGVNPFPVYRPPVAGPSSSGPAGAFAGRRRSPSPDDPGRLDRFVVTAYEADLVRGQPELSLQLEQRRGEGEAKQGRLVRCAVASATGGHDDDGDDTGLWVDRFSHLHLLTSLPSASSATSRPTSPASSWSSLPSDAEDTFFFSDDEGDDYERHKKRRRLDELRARRMEQLEPIEEPGPAEVDADEWGDDDETPPDAILALMKHTFVSLSASPNPALLEMRILAHHGADRRFDFLKGRYARAWRGVKNPAPKADAMGSLLGGYESSEDEDEEGEGGQDAADEAKPMAAPPTDTPDAGMAVDATATPTADEAQEEEKRRLRREKARLWAEKRKAGGEGPPS